MRRKYFFKTFLFIFLFQSILIGGNPSAFSTNKIKTPESWSSINKNASITLSNSNLTANHNATAAIRGIRATTSKISGKHYWEVSCNIVTLATVGLSVSTYGYNSRLAGAGSYGYFSSTGQFYKSGSVFATYSTFGSGTVIGFAWDASTGDLKVYTAGVLQGTVTGVANAAGLFPAVTMDSAGETCTLNFGATAFNLATSNPAEYAALVSAGYALVF